MGILCFSEPLEAFFPDYQKPGVSFREIVDELFVAIELGSGSRYRSEEKGREADGRRSSSG